MKEPMAVQSFLNLIIFIILSGVFLWLVNAYLPMAPLIKTLLNLVVAAVVIIYILQFFHLIPVIMPPIPLLPSRWQA